jgi:hypothetical protein
MIAVKGVMTTTMELVDAVRVLKTPGRIAKHRLFPNPVGKETKTSFPATKLSTASSCSFFNSLYPRPLAALEQAAATA